MTSGPLLLVLATVLVAAHAAGFKDDVAQCKTQTKYQPERSAKDSKEAKCFAACIMEKKGMLTGDSIQKDKLVESYTKRLKDKPEKVQQMRTIVNDCNTQASKSSDKCEKVYTFKECTNKKARETQVFSRQPTPDLENL